MSSKLGSLVHRTAFSASNPMEGFDMKEFNNIRDQVFNQQDMDSAKLWGEKLGDLQQRCFENKVRPACELVSKEMQGASELFGNLTAVTKATAAQAQHILDGIGTEAKTAGMDEVALVLTTQIKTGNHIGPKNSSKKSDRKSWYADRETGWGERFSATIDFL